MGAHESKVLRGLIIALLHSKQGLSHKQPGWVETVPILTVFKTKSLFLIQIPQDAGEALKIRDIFHPIPSKVQEGLHREDLGCKQMTELL